MYTPGTTGRISMIDENKLKQTQANPNSLTKKAAKNSHFPSEVTEGYISGLNAHFSIKWLKLQIIDNFFLTGCPS